MMCDNLYLGVSKNTLDCPIRIYPACHPSAQIEVFVDKKKHEITLVCHKCDRTIAVIKTRKPRSEYRRAKKNAG